MYRLGSVLLICVAGCTSGVTDAPKLYSVTGTLKVDGKPLEATSVALIPAEKDSKLKPALGTTDKEGNFKIATNGDRGAAAGKYKVVLGGKGVDEAPEDSKPKTSQEQAAEVMKMQGELIKSQGKPVKKKYKFPSEWADPKTTPKTFEVTTGTNTLNIDI